MKGLLTVEELAEILNVPVSWIYQQTSRGTIPFVKVGKYLRFDGDVVMNFLKSKVKEDK